MKLCWGSPRPTPGFSDSRGELKGSACSVTCYSKRIQSKNEQREKACEVEARETGASLQESSPRGMQLLQQRAVATHVRCPPPGTLIRDSVKPGFLLGTRHMSSALHLSKLQTLRRKAGVRHKLHCCANSVSPVSPTLISSGNGGDPSEICALSCQLRPTLKEGSPKESRPRPAMLTL